jgi:uncharacterized iron-regulated membrane protein
MVVLLGLFPLAAMLVLLFAACWIHEGRRPATERGRPPARHGAAQR